jgi:hypothetical protein
MMHGSGLHRIDRLIKIAEGNALASDRPGHGVAFDWAALEPVLVIGDKRIH